MKEHSGFFSDRTLAQRYEVSRQTIWRWVREGRLPQPVKLGSGSTRWTGEAIAKFEEGVK